MFSLKTHQVPAREWEEGEGGTKNFIFGITGLISAYVGEKGLTLVHVGVQRG